MKALLLAIASTLGAETVEHTVLPLVEVGSGLYVTLPVDESRLVRLQPIEGSPNAYTLVEVSPVTVEKSDDGKHIIITPPAGIESVTVKTP